MYTTVAMRQVRGGIRSAVKRSVSCADLLLALLARLCQHRSWHGADEDDEAL